MKREIAIPIGVVSVIVAVGVLAVAPQAKADTEAEVKVSTEENIYASFSFDGENIWVEIEGITVRRRFNNVESAVEYVNSKYDVRTRDLLYRLQSFREKTKCKQGEMSNQISNLSQNQRSLVGQVRYWIVSFDNRLLRLEMKVDFLYFAFSLLALGFAGVALFSPEIRGPDPTKKKVEKLEEKVEKLEKKIEEGES